MKEKVIELKNFLEKEEDIKVQIKKIKDEADSKVNKLKTELGLEEVSQHITNLKKELGEQAVLNFKETQSKSYIGGIKVQEKNLVSIEDKEKAFIWAKEHNLCLSLDEKALLAFAKTNYQDSFKEFITKKTVSSATFPKILKLED